MQYCLLINHKLNKKTIVGIHSMFSQSLFKLSKPSASHYYCNLKLSNKDKKYTQNIFLFFFASELHINTKIHKGIL